MNAFGHPGSTDDRGGASAPPRSSPVTSSPGAASGRGWTTEIGGTIAEIALCGDWIGHANGVETGVAPRILQSGVHALTFDCAQLGCWDSALIAFLLELRDSARKAGIAFDESGLPAPARQLLALATAAVAAPPVTPSRPPPLDRVGLWALGVVAEAGEVASLIGSTILRSCAALRGRASMRRTDLLDHLRAGGPAALPIVTVVNLLVGGILAFVGAIQLRRFGADIYVAGMVGIAVVREMAALMTAIIMSGRTGGAYAASIATMQGNDELDALRAIGIPLFDYLILPRVLALTGMMPILYLWGCAVGIFGGFVVAVATLSLSPIAFITETRAAVHVGQFGFGLVKSLTFGALIAIVACRIGLKAGRSAADVGQAATSAVVASVVGVIALDAVFALCANALGV